MQHQRATMAHNSQNVMSLIFPTIAAAGDTPAQRSSDPEAERLIGKEGTKKYSLLPPVLYPPRNTTSQELIFCNPALLQVCTTSCFFFHCFYPSPLAWPLSFIQAVFDRERWSYLQSGGKYNCQKVAGDWGNTWIYRIDCDFGEFYFYLEMCSITQPYPIQLDNPYSFPRCTFSRDRDWIRHPIPYTFQ